MKWPYGFRIDIALAWPDERSFWKPYIHGGLHHFEDIYPSDDGTFAKGLWPMRHFCFSWMILRIGVEWQEKPDAKEGK